MPEAEAGKAGAVGGGQGIGEPCGGGSAGEGRGYARLDAMGGQDSGSGHGKEAEGGQAMRTVQAEVSFPSPCNLSLSPNCQDAVPRGTPACGLEGPCAYWLCVQMRALEGLWVLQEPPERALFGNTCTRDQTSDGSAVWGVGCGRRGGVSLLVHSTGVSSGAVHLLLGVAPGTWHCSTVGKEGTEGGLRRWDGEAPSSGGCECHRATHRASKWLCQSREL